ncbi:MAG TPA: GAF domain-containing protein [Croceibacterium sp.]|jgi:GAF domain-containing protein
MSLALELDDRLRRLDRVVASAKLDPREREEALNELLRAVEGSVPNELLASVLLLSADGKRLLHGGAPSLPKEYCQAIHDTEIGPNVGSCGTVAYLGHAIFVTDIASDPLWADFRELALSHGLAACWSTPIRDASDRLIGTFAVYYRRPRAPTEEERLAIDRIGRRAAEIIALSA